MAQLDHVIIGAGILGLTTASELLKRSPNLKITILEKEAHVAAHQTGRNSGVIHAGVYYKPGSLKAKLCRAGVDKTIAFCKREGIDYEQCGKLIVATDEEERQRLDTLENRASQNNLTLSRLSASELREVEPNITGISALRVKETGIVDYGKICQRLAELLQDQDVTIHFDTQVHAISETTESVEIDTNKGGFTAKTLISCAGIQADKIAAMVGLADDFRIVPFRGEYYRLPDKYDGISDHLIYPVPDPAYPFLGVHLTKMIGGFVTVGPNAVLSLGRENYQRNTPVLKDTLNTLTYAGFWKFLGKNWKAGIYELQGSMLRQTYLERCQKYCPQLTLDDLQPYPTGIRAQAVSTSGHLIDDFLIKNSSRTIHVCNAPSPAATSAFPIAETIVDKIMQ